MHILLQHDRILGPPGSRAVAYFQMVAQKLDMQMGTVYCVLHVLAVLPGSLLRGGGEYWVADRSLSGWARPVDTGRDGE
jgi:hypothetical protein